jgi:putative transcriptional regulator
MRFIAMLLGELPREKVGAQPDALSSSHNCAGTLTAGMNLAAVPRRSFLRRLAGAGLVAALTLPAAVLAGTSSRIAVVPEVPSDTHTRLARGKFLVANRSLQDPTFVETVVLLVDYDDHGALGVVVNRPTGVPLNAALPEVKELRKRKDPIFLGGPVARDRMVLLLRANAAPPESVQVFDQVYATGSLSALRRSLGHGEAVRAYAGYAGWGPGQLDTEVQRGDWLIGPADSKAIFDDKPDDIWSRFVERFSGNWADALPPLLETVSY